MKLEDLAHLIKHVDDLEGYDFDVFYQFMLIRNMKRQIERAMPPTRPGITEGKDCAPTRLN